MIEKHDRLNVLCAYPYMARPLLDYVAERKDDLRIVIDSGAFTAWKLGKPIALDDYCRFLETLPFEPWRYFTLDVIGDPEGTLRNYETMLGRGFRPIPIFTRGEDPSVLEDYYRTSDLVGVGGLVGTRGNKDFVNGIMRQIAGRKVHLLGFTRLDYIKAYRPYMCDASSWARSLRYAILDLFERGRWVTITKKEFVKPPSPALRAMLAAYGVTPEELAISENWKNTAKGTSATERLAYRSYVRAQIEIQNNLGTRFFLAYVDHQQIRNGLDALAYWRAKSP